MSSHDMSPAEFRQVRAAAEAAMDLPEPERPAVLSDLLDGRKRLIESARAWLEEESRAGAFLEHPALASLAVEATGGAAPVQTGQFLGRRVGAYRIERKIAEGGMGAVYLGHRCDGNFEKPVAIKIAHPGSWSHESRRWAVEERQILARMEHPGIARLYDGGTVDGFPYFVMEYVDGRSVTSYCEEKKLALTERIRLVAEIADAVAYAHSHLVVHRDIKPPNILVAPDGSPKLLDFGVAKALAGPEGAEHTTGPGARRLTPSYASPEQLKGRHVSPASDVYSLGVVLYELVTGELPREVASLAYGELDHCLATTPQRPSRRPSGAAGERISPFTLLWKPASADRDLDAVLLKALESDIGRRYRTADAFASDLRRYLEGRPVDARRASVAYSVSRWVRRHRLGAASIFGALVLLAVLCERMTHQQGQITEHLEHAREENRRADAAIQLLVGVIEGWDPAVGGAAASLGPSHSLQAAAGEIRHQLAGHPLLKARLLDTVGAAQLRIGRPRDALEQLQSSAALYAEHGGAGSELAASRLHLGKAMSSLGRHDEAVKLLGEAARAFRKLDPAEPAQLAEALVSLGQAQLYAGDPSGAETSMRSAVSMAESESLPVQQAANALNGLGQVLSLTQSHAVSQPFHERALELQRSRLEGESPALAETLILLARAVEAAGDAPRAASLLEAALRQRESFYGAESPLVGETLLELARLSHGAGRLDEAEQRLERGCSILEASRGPQHRDAAACLLGRGELEMSRGRLDEAEALFMESLERLEAEGAPDHHRVMPLRDLAAVAWKRGDLPAARSYLEQGLAKLEDLGGEPSSLQRHLSDLRDRVVAEQQKRAISAQSALADVPAPRD